MALLQQVTHLLECHVTQKGYFSHSIKGRTEKFAEAVWGPDFRNNELYLSVRNVSQMCQIHKFGVVQNIAFSKDV